MGSGKSDIGIGGGRHGFEKREGAIVEFHHYAFERIHSGFDFEKLEIYGLVWAENGAGGDAEQESVADLSGGTGDCDIDGLFHDGI